MDYCIEIVVPLEPSKREYETSRKRALERSRSLFSHKVNIHDQGGLMATKEPGTHRITFLRR